MLNITKGSGADTLYVQFNESAISHSVELHPDIILDVNENGAVVGIDIQNVSQLAAEAHEMRGYAQPLPEVSAAAFTPAANPGLGQFGGMAEPGRLVYVPA